jgi:hypothetical protein
VVFFRLGRIIPTLALVLVAALALVLKKSMPQSAAEY